MLISTQNLLLLLAASAGILLLAGTLWLLYNQRIYLDGETKKVTEIELPLLGKWKTQSPVLVMLAIGAALVLYPLTRTPSDLVTVQGYIETDSKPVTVTLVAVPRFQQTVYQSGSFKLRVPVFPDVDYRAWFTVDKNIASDTGIDIAGGGAQVVRFSYKEPSQVAALAPRKEVSDAELLRLGIH